MEEEELPLVLPETDDFRPSGTSESPLANIASWVNITDPQTGELPGFVKVHMTALAGIQTRTPEAPALSGIAV